MFHKFFIFHWLSSIQIPCFGQHTSSESFCLLGHSATYLLAHIAKEPLLSGTHCHKAADCGTHCHYISRKLQTSIGTALHLACIVCGTLNSVQQGSGKLATTLPQLATTLPQLMNHKGFTQLINPHAKYQIMI